MANQLRAEQKSIGQILSEPRASFLIPDYQRPYSWEREQCETLWADLHEFAFPNGNKDDFDINDKYFLGTILTFQNSPYKYEVIDGQQRLVTFLLMFRAFYEAFGNMQDDNSMNVRKKIEQCIWHTDEDEHPDKNSSKIISEVITDNDNAEFRKIITTGKATKSNNSNYAKNYRDFQKWIKKFKEDTPDYFSYLPRRILNNCIILPIETDSQETALQIFTTLNDRGLPLSDTDILKAQFYKFYSEDDEKKSTFIEDWKTLEELCGKIFHPKKGISPLEELFTTYMYYLKAKDGSRTTSFKSLRKFYEQDNYKYLQDETFEDLKSLADFWKNIYARDYNRFSERVLRQLYILEYSPYAIWRHAVSAYFLVNNKNMTRTDDKAFYKFLKKLTAFILAHSIYKPGVGSIRLPIHNEIVNIYQKKQIEFKGFKIDATIIAAKYKEMVFSNQRQITRAMLAWWIFRDEEQELPLSDTKLEIEHIYSKSLKEFLLNGDNLELLGNKSLLESTINVHASGRCFADKKKFYLGQKIRGKKQIGTKILELRRLAEECDDFTERDILDRNEEIFDAFVDYLREQNLLI